MMIGDANAVVSLPESLNAVDAAPLLCAGVTTYNALRNAPLRSGDLGQCRVLAASVISAFSLPGGWVSVRRRSRVAARCDSRKDFPLTTW